MIGRTRIESSLAAVLRSLLRPGRDSVARFEHGLKAFFGVPDVVTVGSGRAALYLVLKACPERRVYLTPYVCSAVPEACLRAGKELRFIDVDLATLNMDVDRLAAALEPRSILLAVHAFGLPSEIQRIRELAGARECRLVEDNAAAFGSRYRARLTGTFGSAGVLSFDWSKTLVTGRGGAILFGDPDLAARVRALGSRESSRSGGKRALLATAACLLAMQPGIYGTVALPLWTLRHGPFRDRGGVSLGPDRRYTVAMAPSQAALGCRSLTEIDRVLARRREIADRYRRELGRVDGLAVPQVGVEADPVFTLFPVRILGGDKMTAYRACRAQGVDLGFSYSYACAPGHPNAAQAAAQVLNLPLYSSLSDAEAERVVASVKRALPKTAA